MPGKRRLRPYVIEPLPPGRVHGHNYVAAKLDGGPLDIYPPVTGKSEEVVRQRMAKKHPEYGEQPRLFAAEESDMSAYQRIEDGGEQR